MCKGALRESGLLQSSSAWCSRAFLGKDRLYKRLTTIHDRLSVRKPAKIAYYFQSSYDLAACTSCGF